jgi:SAM-dependent methyltransferase
MLVRVRIYGDLAPWFHLVTHPSDYGAEAAFITAVIDEVAQGTAATLLELGSGGGNNASHLKKRFECTLTDISEPMLEVSRTINPECEHVRGDMRTLRLGRKFDAVLVHDAVMYMTREDDLAAAIETAAAHVRPGGAVVLLPDCTLESFHPATEHGGGDGDDGRGLRFLEWTHEPAPGGTFIVDYVLALEEPGHPLRIEHDRHTFGLFAEATWLSLIERAGLQPVAPVTRNPHAHEQATFVALRPRA